MKTVIAVAFSLLLAFPVFSQDSNKRKERQDKIENLKIAFITKELNLTPEESQKFWPIYNDYQSKLKALRKDARGDKKRGNSDEMSDAEAEKMLESYLNMQSQKLDLEAETMDRLKPILGAKRVLKLMKVEGKFKRKILNKAGKGKSKSKVKGKRKGEHKGKRKHGHDGEHGGDNDGSGNRI